MNRNQQTHMGLSDACYYADHRGCPFPTMCECSCHKSLAGDSTPPATPVESPDENWFQRQARLAARDVQLLPPWLRSHPPAVSGEGERLKELLADLQTLENTYNTDRVAQVQARQIERIFDRWLHSTPTPGAPR